MDDKWDSLTQVDKETGKQNSKTEPKTCQTKLADLSDNHFCDGYRQSLPLTVMHLLVSG